MVQTGLFLKERSSQGEGELPIKENGEGGPS